MNPEGLIPKSLLYGFLLKELNRDSGRQDIITKAYKSPVIATTLGLGMVGTFVGGGGYLGDALPWGTVL